MDVPFRGKELSALAESSQYGFVGLEDVDSGELRDAVAVPAVIADVLGDLEARAQAQLEVVVAMGRSNVDQPGTLIRAHEVAGMKRHGMVVPGNRMRADGTFERCAAQRG